MSPQKCLLVKCKDLVMTDIMWGLLELGHSCESLDLSCNTLELDLSEAKRLEDYVNKNPVDIVFTMNFSPTVSTACNNLSTPYASWIYDCPLQSLYAREAFFQTNYFFIFDKYQLEDCKKRGLPNTFYLPLAANITRMGQLQITAEDEENYSCDISFVGMQYVDGRYAYYHSHLDDSLKNELDSIAFSIIGKWDKTDRIHNRLSDELLAALLELSDEDPSQKLGLPNKVFFEEAVIARAIAYTERRLIMEAISDLSPRWYGAGGKDSDHIEGVQYFPWLTYLDALPKAYNLSKINISTSLHSISSGIPLRVFDIMGAGGFILTNYQPEIEEIFDIGKEIVVYHSIEEMSALARFFLNHEAERTAILLNGYERICNSYTYPIALSKMIKFIFS